MTMVKGSHDVRKRRRWKAVNELASKAALYKRIHHETQERRLKESKVRETRSHAAVVSEQIVRKITREKRPKSASKPEGTHSRHLHLMIQRLELDIYIAGFLGAYNSKEISTSQSLFAERGELTSRKKVNKYACISFKNSQTERKRHSEPYSSKRTDQKWTDLHTCY